MQSDPYAHLKTIHRLIGGYDNLDGSIVYVPDRPHTGADEALIYVPDQPRSAYLHSGSFASTLGVQKASPTAAQTETAPSAAEEEWKKLKEPADIQNTDNKALKGQCIDAIPFLCHPDATLTKSEGNGKAYCRKQAAHCDFRLGKTTKSGQYSAPDEFYLAEFEKEKLEKNASGNRTCQGDS